MNIQEVAKGLELLEKARIKLYQIAGGAIDSNDDKAAILDTAKRTEFFRSIEFCQWVEFEKARGNQVFWLKDVDDTQSAGDIFAAFFQWRADNSKFTNHQLSIIKSALLKRQNFLNKLSIHLTRMVFSIVRLFTARWTLPSFASLTPYDVLKLWRAHEKTGKGIKTRDFWHDFYWPSQVGMSRQEKQAQVHEFAPHHRESVYEGVFEENQTLTAAGVTPVIVTNGDQELAMEAAPILGIKPENVVGADHMYIGDLSTGEHHNYDIYDERWSNKPQPGKVLSFHYWVHKNLARFGWDFIDERRIVIAGIEGDSASSDGGMMIFLPSPAIGFFIIDSPGHPERARAFHAVAAKYSWMRGKFFTLVQKLRRAAS